MIAVARGDGSGRRRRRGRGRDLVDAGDDIARRGQGARRRRRGLRRPSAARCSTPPGARRGPGRALLPIGFAGGEVPQVPANLLLVKNLTRDRLLLQAPGLRRAPAACARSFETLLAWYLAGAAAAARQPRAAARGRNEGARPARDRAGPPARWSVAGRAGL